ncbi:MAG: hypothetical protein COA79_22360 [Planctomycetota bacterium]|nr:MAG: hypothetical protein COA79_22360 [Planctomycetota bacterium]
MKRIAIFLLFTASIILGADTIKWHTSPDKWKEPRNYHTKFKKSFEENIIISHGSFPAKKLEIIKSPNKAYSFGIFRPDTTKKAPWTTKIFINNEKKASLVVILRDHSQYMTKAKWINEKLLFVRVHWGRILWSDIILDVETEKIIYKEMVNDGTIAFQQFKQGFKKK